MTDPFLHLCRAVIVLKRRFFPPYRKYMALSDQARRCDDYARSLRLQWQRTQAFRPSEIDRVVFLHEDSRDGLLREAFALMRTPTVEEMGR